MTNELDDTLDFVSSIVAQSPAIQHVITLASAVSHCVGEFTHVPRVAFLSTDFRTGKTTGLKTARMLSANPQKVTRATTDPAVLAMFNTDAKPTLFVEELSEIFGKDGRLQRKPNLRLVILDGFERAGEFGFSVNRTHEPVSIFCLLFGAGRGVGFPDDGRDRAIVCPMRRSERTMARHVDDRETVALGEYHHGRLRSWVADNRPFIGALAREMGPEIHPDLVSRRRDIWAPMFAVAHARGDVWPAHCLAAFRELALGNSDTAKLTIENRIRLEAGAYVRVTKGLPARDNGAAILRSSALLDHLRTVDFALFRDARDRSLQLMITAALGESRVFTVSDVKVRGWDTFDVLGLAEDIEAELSVPREVRSAAPTEDF